MKINGYESMKVSELRRLAIERKIPIPASINEMRGVTSDPYAEQGRRNLIVELKATDTRLRERRQDIIAIVTLIAAIASAVIGAVALLYSKV